MTWLDEQRPFYLVLCSVAGAVRGVLLRAFLPNILAIAHPEDGSGFNLAGVRLICIALANDQQAVEGSNKSIDFQSGIHLGKRGLLSDNDIFVFGALGGFVHSDLDYDAINRIFSFNGGRVGDMPPT
jgi:hypothetical protein